MSRAVAATALVVAISASAAPVRAADAPLPNLPNVTLPNLIWLPGPTGGHLWVSDNVSGFCKFDWPAGGTPRNTGMCSNAIPNPGQAAFDPIGNYIFLSSTAARGNGLLRLKYDPVTETITNGSNPDVLGDGTTFGLRPNSLALSPVLPDGSRSLYFGFVKSGQIMRITHASEDVWMQYTELVGTTSDGRGVNGGMAFVKNNLYIGEVGGNGVTTIADPAMCNPLGIGGGCQADLTPITSTFPGGLASLNDDYLFVGDSTVSNVGTVLRYQLSTDTQDTVSTNVPAYTSPFDGVHTRYAAITGLAIDAATGDLYAGDDPTARAARPPTLQGHVWRLPAIARSTTACGAGVTGACIDAPGRPGVPATVPAPPSVAAPARLLAWGQTSPIGLAWVPGDLGGHYWVGDHTQGLCRLDATPATAGLDPSQLVFTAQPMACDPGQGIIGSPGQIVYDAPFIYVPDVAVRSPGVWRLPFDAATETVGTPVLLAPGTGLDNARIIGLALGPDGSLYAGGLKNGFIYRITNPRGDPAQQTTDVIGVTNDNRGINGTIGFIGNDLYLPENRGMSVLKGATSCAICTAEMVSITGLTFGQSIATNRTDTLYVSTAAGGSPAVIFRYKPASGAVDVYATQGTLPDGASPAAEEFCSESCRRQADPNTPFGGLVGFHFAIGMYVDPRSGNLLVGDDPLAGNRGFRGHVWSVPFAP